MIDAIDGEIIANEMVDSLREGLEKDFEKTAEKVVNIGIYVFSPTKNYEVRGTFCVRDFSEQALQRLKTSIKEKTNSMIQEISESIESIMCVMLLSIGDIPSFIVGKSFSHYGVEPIVITPVDSTDDGLVRAASA